MKNIDQQPDSTRRQQYADMFYLGDPVALTKQIEKFLDSEPEILKDAKPVGLVSPHAGYIYSGSCAAAGYKAVRGKQYDSVVVISPSHQMFFNNSSVYNGGAYQTPLGNVFIDLELAATIANIHPKVVFSNHGHTGGASPEHALEVQLPFLQVALGDFKLVPIVMGSQEYDQSIALGEVLGSALKNRNALIVASSDLSHYNETAVAQKMDNGIKDAIVKYDWKLLHDRVSSGYSQACGAAPIIACMYASSRLGADKSEILKYTHSGRGTGDEREVVGYMSAVFFK